MQTGDQAPNIAFVRPNGTAGDLIAYRGRPLLLIFLRHLG